MNDFYRRSLELLKKEPVKYYAIYDKSDAAPLQDTEAHWLSDIVNVCTFYGTGARLCDAQGIILGTVAADGSYQLIVEGGADVDDTQSNQA